MSKILPRQIYIYIGNHLFNHFDLEILTCKTFWTHFQFMKFCKLASYRKQIVFVKYKKNCKGIINRWYYKNDKSLNFIEDFECASNSDGTLEEAKDTDFLAINIRFFQSFYVFHSEYFEVHLISVEFCEKFNCF